LKTFVKDLSEAAPEPPEDSVASSGLSEEIRPWWQRSPLLASGAAFAIGLATLWFASMLGRVPLDSQSTFGYLLMLPLLLIVPAFSAAAFRLSWLAWHGAGTARRIVGTIALAATIANGLAIAGFGTAIMRIFSH
jgi:hypothetical protein